MWMVCLLQGYVDDMIQDVVDCLCWINDNVGDYGGDKVNNHYQINTNTVYSTYVEITSNSICAAYST
jgi:hypothetical protein